MAARSKIWMWTLLGLASVGLIVFLLGPVLFASVAYPLPDNFRAPIATRAQQYGINPNALAALTFVESGFNLNARSGAGAIGPTQFLGSTARAVAKRLGVSPFSPEDLTRSPDLAEWFAAYYLSEGVRNYGTLHLAFVAYNGGGAAANASIRGYPFPATEGYANKIERIKLAYDAIYGEWWHGAQPVSTSVGTTSLEFKVQPNVDVANVTAVPIVNLWQNLLSNPSANSKAATSDNEPAPGDINNLWKALIPGT